MPYLLDTNVISEAIKPRPEPRVLTWLAAQSASAIYLSVLTLGELEQGIARSPHPLRLARLARWLEEDVLPRFRDRLLVVDVPVMKTWGQITGRALVEGRPTGYVDSLLAATAIVHGLTLVTRNTADVAALPVPTINPWDEGETS